MNIQQTRQQILNCFQAALARVHGQASVERALDEHALTGQSTVVVAIGKAAAAMAKGAENMLHENFHSGLLISKHGHIEKDQLDKDWICHEASHPVPDETSLKAGQLLLTFLEKHKYMPVLFLISGGASSLVEVLPDSVQDSEWQDLNRWLLASGLDITAVNVVRKSLSQIKGGRLLNYLEHHDVHSLLISDVPGDQPHVIGSGLLFPTGKSLSQEQHNDKPGWVKQILEKACTDVGAVKEGCEPVSYSIVATRYTAMEAAQEYLESLAHVVHVHEAFLEGDAQQAGQQLARYLVEEAEPGFHIWSGETTVVLPENPGRGGRNQHLALAAACELAGHENLVLLSAGTDGSDGPTQDAGALVDAFSLERGRQQGLDVEQYLARADSGSFLEVSGDLVSTGPTGTNVMDLVIACKGET